MSDDSIQDLSLQERFAPDNRCFGCGPSNEQGLRIRSFPVDSGPDCQVVAEWSPEPRYEAFEDILNGGIIGTLLDCHSNWTAVWHLICRDSLQSAPPTVTADFHVRLKRPTPTGRPIRLIARAVSSDGPRVTVEAEILADDTVTAVCRGHFVAVEPGHPAYRRW
jgi:acyl-coenzyme A thioesterase PaaI-like protein